MKIAYLGGPQDGDVRDFPAALIPPPAWLVGAPPTPQILPPAVSREELDWDARAEADPSWTPSTEMYRLGARVHALFGRQIVYVWGPIADRLQPPPPEVRDVTDL